MPPPKKKNWEKYFSGNYYVKFGHLSGKNRVKFGNFVNFSGKNDVKFGHFDNFSSYFSGRNVGHSCKQWSQNQLPCSVTVLID